VIGIGLAIGTVFTLFVVPAFYTVIAKKRVRQGEERSGTELAPQKA
jgi:multidrug efflux pump